MASRCEPSTVPTRGNTWISRSERLRTAAGTSVSGRSGEATMRYGLIGRMKAVRDKREEIASVLMAGTAAMPGCRSYPNVQPPHQEHPRP